jgi:hypothetical protein
MNLFMRQMRESAARADLNRWVDRLAGEPAFVLGNGPSLPADLSNLAGRFTIGCNRIYERLDPTVLVWLDWEIEANGGADILRRSQAVKFATRYADPEGICPQHFVIDAKQKETFSKVISPTPCRGNSGYRAVLLAYALGCSPIVLLGMDGKPTADGQTHFYGTCQCWAGHDWVTDRFRVKLQAIRDLCPVPIISCSSNDFFPRESLADVLCRLPAGKGRDFYRRQLA